MPRAFFVALILSAAAYGWSPDDEPNVNSRYTVESVHVAGYRSSKISTALRSELEAVVGQKFDQTLLDRISVHIRRDLRVEKVAVKVSRGTQPEHVKIDFFVENQRSTDFDIGVPMFTYNSKQGWSGRGEVRTDIAGNRLSLALVSDGNELVERFSGIETKIARRLGTSRILIGFEFDSYHEQWNRATEDAALTGGLYRSRQNFQPSMTILLAEPLTLSVGVSVQSLEQQFPSAMTQSSNLLVSALRYHGNWSNGGAGQSVDAGYIVRAATRALGSDFVFLRNTIDARYQLTSGKQMVIVSFLAGAINGQAPLFERFVLGNSNTLRGWNKFNLDPTGGDRVVHGSVEYRWRYLQAFYDTGAVWDRRTEPDQKQSVGIGVRSSSKDGLLLAVAFPLKNGRVDPVFIAEFNF
jgi:outer membrane protein assembly factor BamA